MFYILKSPCSISVSVIKWFCSSLRSGKDDIFGENPDDKNSGWTSVNKSNYCVRALSYCDLHKVMVADLQDILSLYPEFAVGFLQHFQVTFNLRLVSLCSKTN